MSRAKARLGLKSPQHSWDDVDLAPAMERARQSPGKTNELAATIASILQAKRIVPARLRVFLAQAFAAAAKKTPGAAARNELLIKLLLRRSGRGAPPKSDAHRVSAAVEWKQAEYADMGQSISQAQAMKLVADDTGLTVHQVRQRRITAGAAPKKPRRPSRRAKSG